MRGECCNLSSFPRPGADFAKRQSSRARAQVRTAGREPTPQGAPSRVQQRDRRVAGVHAVCNVRQHVVVERRESRARARELCAQTLDARPRGRVLQVCTLRAASCAAYDFTALCNISPLHSLTKLLSPALPCSQASPFQRLAHASTQHSSRAGAGARYSRHSPRYRARLSHAPAPPQPPRTRPPDQRCPHGSRASLGSRAVCPNAVEAAVG